MAFWVVGGAGNGSPLPDGPFAARRHADSRHVSMNSTIHIDQQINLPDNFEDCHWESNQRYGAHQNDAPSDNLAQSVHSVPVRNLSYLVIREGPARSLSPSPRPYSCPSETLSSNHFHSRSNLPVPLERTESGLSISSDVAAHHHSNFTEHAQEESLLEDHQAAALVRHHIKNYRRRFPDSQPERILKALIKPKSRGAEFQLDNEALRSIFLASNELFFASRLTRRVAWDWSNSKSEQYVSHIVGTTAIRRSSGLGGWETLIVLSSPILKDTKYNRRLLISTFLHEMIHCFMFVTCGLKAKESGGHTTGFRQIAGIIDDWAGKDCLHLRDMEANLSRWYGADFSAIDTTHDFDYLNNTSQVDQAAWNSHYQSHGHGDYVQPPLPRGGASQDEWQWYKREDFGDCSHYAANSQYAL